MLGIAGGLGIDRGGPPYKRSSTLKFLVGGQSNASGRGELTAPETGDPRAYMFGNDYVWKLASEPVDSITGQIDAVSNEGAGVGHSFQLAALKNIVAARGGFAAVIPCAKGSTSAANWSPNSENLLDRSTLFGSAKYRQMVAAPGGLTALWWFGHESSATATGNPWYRVRWAALVKRLRRDMSTAPIIFAQLGKHQTAATNTAQLQAGTESMMLESGYPATPLVVGAPVIDTDFAAVEWADGAPLGWALENTDANNTVSKTAFGARFVSDGSKSLGLKAAVLVNATQYLVEVEVSKIVTDGLKLFTNTTANTSFTASTGGPEVYRNVFTANGTTLHIFRNGGPTDATIRSIKVWPYTSGDIWQPLDNHHMVVTFDLPLLDIIHLNADAQKEVGRRFGLATRQHVLGENVNGTGPRMAATGAFTHPIGDKSKVKVKFNKPINDGAATKYNGQFRVYDGAVEMTILTAERDASDVTAVLITMSAAATGAVTVSYGDVAATGAGVWLADVVKDTDNLPAPQFSAQSVV